MHKQHQISVILRAPQLALSHSSSRQFTEWEWGPVHTNPGKYKNAHSQLKRSPSTLSFSCTAVFGMVCIHVPHWNDFDKQLSWLRDSCHATICRVVTGDTKVHCRPTASRSRVQACGSVIATKRHRFWEPPSTLTTLQHRFQCRNSPF